jgi:hypothetical protein
MRARAERALRVALATRTIRNEPDVNGRCGSWLRTARRRLRGDFATGTLFATASTDGH